MKAKEKRKEQNILIELATTVYLIVIPNKIAFINECVDDAIFKGTQGTSVIRGFLCVAKDATKEDTNQIVVV